jgi:hypothetical protein
MKHEEIMHALRSACNERLVCHIRLKEETEDRIVNPLGVCFSKKDMLMLVCMLSKPPLESKNPSLYRNLFIENVGSVEITDANFTVPKDFNPFSSQYSGWLFHVLKLST